MDAETLKMQYNFNITLDHHQFGEMFIVCGNLYAIDSGTDKNTQIRYVVDLYKGKLLNTNLPFSNPFSHTTTVGYNPLTVVSFIKKKIISQKIIIILCFLRNSTLGTKATPSHIPFAIMNSV